MLRISQDLHTLWPLCDGCSKFIVRGISCSFLTGVNSESSDTCPLGHAMGRPSRAFCCSLWSAVRQSARFNGIACSTPDTLNASYLMRGTLFFCFKIFFFLLIFQEVFMHIYIISCISERTNGKRRMGNLNNVIQKKDR